MTSPVFLRLASEQAYHRLLTVGVVRHVAACRQTIPADSEVILTATEPPPELACPGCARDLAVKRQRVPTVDLRPSVRDLGAYAELTVSLETDWDDCIPDGESIH